MVKIGGVIPVINVRIPAWRVGSIVTIAVAILVWIGTSYVTVRNSVKQHTMNVLLESRLSETYLRHAKAVARAFQNQNGALTPMTQAEYNDPPPEIDFGSLNYQLNYFEFIAVGIRHGDLDESLLKESMRGIVCSVFCIADVYIQNCRKGSEDPKRTKTFEHLCWLHRRWRNDSALPPRALRQSPQPAKPTEPAGLTDRLYFLVKGVLPP
ncbi:MAG TPA: DUF4760 domain-containing protein [Pseudorhodoferax sp.]|nr:DUF4760 domain-containing protein [Pseudorhodoferax sp.]